METITAAGAITLAVCLRRNGTVITNGLLPPILTFHTLSYSGSFSSSNYYFLVLFFIGMFSLVYMNIHRFLWT